MSCDTARLCDRCDPVPHRPKGAAFSLKKGFLAFLFTKMNIRDIIILQYVEFLYEIVFYFEKGKYVMLKKILCLLVALLPICLALCGFVSDITTYEYPKINRTAILLTILSLLPSVLFLLITRVNPEVNKKIKTTILILCAIMIPFSFIAPLGIFGISETTDITNYRELDPGCIANRSRLFGELFPAWPHYFEVVKNEDGEWETVYLDAEYYYRYFTPIDYTYDIYAEWPLDDDEFTKEVQRAREVMERRGGENLLEIKKGDFTCLIIYNGSEPFQEADDNYTYCIFAYNEKTNVVRYIYCDSLENGADQPYYLQLDW